MQITLNQIKKIIGGEYQGDVTLLKKKIKRISINSNDIHKGDLFIGIKGEKFVPLLLFYYLHESYILYSIKYLLISL